MGRSDSGADGDDDDDDGWCCCCCCCDGGDDDRRFVVDGTASRSCDESGWARRRKPEAASTPSFLVAGSASHATQAKQKMSGSFRGWKRSFFYATECSKKTAIICTK